MLVLAWLAVIAITPACRSAGSETDELRLTWTLDPTPAAVGPATVTIRLLSADGQAIPGARLRLEGHMTHPGMAPVIADVREPLAGRYEADLSFTMSGDWVLLLSGELPDGRRLRRELAVPGVRQAH